MNAHDIDWTQAPEGYDYYIVDTHGEQKSEFHRLDNNDFRGDLYIDQRGFNWTPGSDRLEVYQRPTVDQRPEQAEPPKQLRCVSTDGEYFTEGKLYNVVEVLENTGSYVLETEGNLTLIVLADTLTVAGFPELGTFGTPQEVTHLRCIETNDDELFTLGHIYGVISSQCDGGYIVRGDDNCTWCVNKHLKFAGTPEIGRFEVVSTDAPEPEAKTQPEFGDIVHVNGVPYVFIRVDEDGDYYLVSSGGDECYLGLDDMDEYAHKDSATKLRNLILTDIREFCNNSLEDNMTSVVNFNIPELINFIMMYKDNWDL